MLSCLHAIERLIILRVSLYKTTEFKFKGSIDMVTSTSKHDITKEKHKYCTLKLNNKKK